MILDLLFLLFGTGLLAGATLVIAARNPMVSVMGMILSFLNAAGLFIVLQAEFLGLLLIMVYVGAIAVMFLFVLMTIDIDYIKLREGIAPYLPAGLLVVGLLAAELVLAALSVPHSPLPVANANSAENIVLLGQVLFTNYALTFQLAGLILLTAMVGAIVLTHRPRGGVQRQNIAKQIFRKRADAMVITQPAIGQGATPQYYRPKSVSEKKKKGHGNDA